MAKNRIEGVFDMPKQIFARRVVRPDDDEPFIEANETADEFDDEGSVGRYELVEEGTITIENAFVAKDKRALRDRV